MRFTHSRWIRLVKVLVATKLPLDIQKLHFEMYDTSYANSLSNFSANSSYKNEKIFLCWFKNLCFQIY